MVSGASVFFIKRAIPEENWYSDRRDNLFPVADRETALNWMAVDPAHRLRGIGCLLMDVGIARADELDLECWMEASGMGRPLYEKFGFQSLLKIAFETEKRNASDEWRRCAHELTPPPIIAMWRSTKSSREGGQGQPRMPWTLGTHS